MKPKLNQTVYIICTSPFYYITRERAAYLGSDRFVTDNLGYNPSYESYNKTWFLTLTKAKQYLRIEFENTDWDRKTKFKLKQIKNGYWQVEY